MVKGGSLSKKVLSSLLIIALLTLCCPWFVSENSKAAAATYLYPKTLATDGEKLYVATDQGLLVWNGKVFSEVKPPHLPSVKITTVNADPSTSLIVGTDNGAAYPFRQSYWRVVTTGDGLPASSVTAAANCKNQIFIGTSNGLAVYTKNSTNRPIIYQYPELPHNNVTSLVCSGDQAFVGTMSGIMRITGNNAYYISPVSTTKMLVSGGKLWVASSQGLFQFDLQGRLLKRWDVNSGLYSSNIKALAAAEDSVYVYDGKNIVRIGDMKKFPVSVTIYDMVYMKGQFFLATPNGLFSTYDFLDYVNVFKAQSYLQDAFYSGTHLVELRNNIVLIDGRPANISGVVKAYQGDWVTVVTSNQVYLVNPSSLSRYTVKSDAFFEIAPHSIQSAYYSASSGMLYLASYGQLYAIHRTSGTFQKTAIPLYGIKSLWSDGKFVYLLADRGWIIADSWGKVIRSGTWNFYVRDVTFSDRLIFIATDQGVKYGSSLWSGFRNYASLDALRLFSPANSKNLWASTTKGLVKMGTEPIYYNWGNGLLALPDNMLSDTSSLKLFIGGKIYQWQPSHMVDWLGSIGKEEASKLQAAGILAGFHGKTYPTKTLTYQELAVFYARLKDIRPSNVSTNARADTWAKPYIAALEQKGFRLDMDYRLNAQRNIVQNWIPELSYLFRDSGALTRQKAVSSLYSLLPY